LAKQLGEIVDGVRRKHALEASFGGGRAEEVPQPDVALSPPPAKT